MKIGILGAGIIARKMAYTMAGINGAELYALASRDKAKAQAFADEFGVQKAFGSYESMLEDASLSLVYIATPHSHHHEHAQLCIAHGKHVLCEKAFTANAAQARDVIASAHSHGVLVTEAIWTRYMPMRKIIADVIASGIIGEVSLLTANLGYPLEHIPRMQEPALAGGTLLDLGVYALNFASMFFGNDIASVDAHCVKTAGGVDAQETITLTYADGKIASLVSTMRAVTDRRGIIHGTKGFIEVGNINNFEYIKVFDTNYREIAHYDAPPHITGYEYEVIDAMAAIERGDSECPAMPHAETVFIMELMDRIRAQLGVTFPFE